ncbi:MAG TPA: hypothetical protein VFV10_19355 [Gammaproteobacteria bacterium]|nr:hypothetical protein [Gammaproteobacteria bacterium]
MTLGKSLRSMAFGMLLVCIASLATARAGEKSDVEDIRGFRVDFHLVGPKQKERVLPSLYHQIEIVDSVHLPEAVSSFFHTIPLVVDPALTKMNGEYARMGDRWVVHVKPADIPGDRAILLHELLHAYQHQVLKEPTPPVGRAYQQALRPGTYPDDFKGAYFLSNGREFFAVIGEIYLDGKTFRPPFTCSAVQKAQPQFIEYLASLFGPHDCR